MWVAKNFNSVEHLLSYKLRSQLDYLVDCAKSHASFQARVLRYVKSSPDVTTAVDGYYKFLGVAKKHPGDFLVPLDTFFHAAITWPTALRPLAKFSLIAHTVTLKKL